MAAQPQGSWRGVIQQANADVAAQLSFRADAVDVHFDDPFACNVTAKLLKDSDTTTVYRFGISPNGGPFCDGLLSKDLTVTPGNESHLAIDFASARTAWRGDLTPVPAPVAATPTPTP